MCGYYRWILDEGIIVYTESRNGERYYEKSTNKYTDIPLIV